MQDFSHASCQRQVSRVFLCITGISRCWIHNSKITHHKKRSRILLVCPVKNFPVPQQIPESFIQKCAIVAGFICLLLFAAPLVTLNSTPDYLDLLSRNGQMIYVLAFLAILGSVVTIVSLLLLMEIWKK